MHIRYIYSAQSLCQCRSKKKKKKKKKQKKKQKKKKKKKKKTAFIYIGHSKRTCNAICSVFLCIFI